MGQIEKMVEAIKTQIGRKMLEEQKKEAKRFFISDTHFQDSRLNLYGRDLIFKNSDEVDEHIVKKCNEVMPKDATLYHLGDVSMTLEGLENINKIKCKKKILIKGNYDISAEKGGTAKYEINDKILLKYFDEVYDDLEIEIDGEIIYLNHFPTNARPDVFNIAGHIHGLWKVQRNIVNVGVDIYHFTPPSEDLIKFQINGIRKFYDQNVFAGELNASIKNRIGVVKVLRAPEYDKVSTFEENEDVVVFLAGPIQGAEEWQESFVEKIQKEFKDIKLKKNIVIASPRRLEKPDKNKFDYDEQVDWESFYLDKASKQGIVVFWMPVAKEKIEGRSYAQTTRFEIGEWWAKGQKIDNFSIVVGAQKDFDGTRYVEKKFKEKFKDFELHSNEKQMIEEIVKQIKNKL